MSQMPQRPCPNCGAPIAFGQRFCTNCGTVLEAQPQPPSQYGEQPPAQNYQYQQAWQSPSYAQQQQMPPYMQQPQQRQSPIAEALGALGLLFLLRGFGRRYRGYTPQRQSSGCCGCLVLLVILFIVIGLPAYFLAKPSISNVSKSLNISSFSGKPATQPPITKVQINETVPYAGVDITVVSAQQTQTFLDDHASGTDGMVRLNLKESSATGKANFFYGDVAHLILPDKTSVAPVNEQQLSSPGAGVTRTNWLDFPVPTSIQISQLTLQLGKDSESQVNVPLTGKASLAQYQPKTTKLNASTQYAGLTWTITSATAALSDDGKQADKGMQYVTVTMKVDNPTSSDFRAYWGDYFRLQAGGATSAPEVDSISGKFPLDFAAGSAGTTGSLTFLLPADSTSYTLILLGKPTLIPPINQATANFQVT
jgi:zinc-ribbon domain